MQTLPKSIQNFLQNPITIENLMCLAYHYPNADIESFNDFQNGYRYNNVTQQSLIGTKQGDWQADWYVISYNYFSDPFIINIQEQDKGFPVYFAYSNTGSWEFVKFCDNLDEFSTILKTLQTLQQSTEQMLIWINQYIKNKDNVELWQEIVETLEENLQNNE